MIAVENTVLVLLAAGRSERWGQIDSKLEEVFLGHPLGLHVAVALEDMPFRERIAVTGRARLDFARHRFRTVATDEPEGSMAHSVRVGVAAAREQGADAVLIALADMPRITAAHIYRLFDATGGADTVVASSDGCDPCPPAIFGRDRFEFLMELRGAEVAMS
jgi:molybdenum cofactor cytidylyltransferase